MLNRYQSKLKRSEALNAILRANGYPTNPGHDRDNSLNTLAEYATFDSVSPGVCTYRDCAAVAEDVEPDATHNACSCCDRPGVQSLLVLMGVI